MLGITNSWAAYQLDYVTALVATEVVKGKGRGAVDITGMKPGDTLPDGRKVGSWT